VGVAHLSGERQTANRSALRIIDECENWGIILTFANLRTQIGSGKLSGISVVGKFLRARSVSRYHVGT